MILEIEGKDIKCREDFHLLMKEKLDFPDYYGMNLDAFWDVMYPLPVDHLMIIWKDYSVSKRNLAKYFEDIINTLDDLKEKEPNFDYQLID